MRSNHMQRTRPVIVAADSRPRARYQPAARPFVQGEIGPGKFFLTLFFFALMVPAIIAPAGVREQGYVAGGVVLLCAIISVLVPRFRLLVAALSALSSMRYIYWRGAHTLSLDSWPDLTISVLLFAGEVYGVMILLLGYFQTVKLQRRQPLPLPEEEELLPSVDVFITTYNEDREIVRRTAVGAMAMDYPKKTVYLLDDGHRESMRDLAEEVGCHYITRRDNRHAKAGNINNALLHTTGDLIAIFDADHVPVSSFLRETVGYFLDQEVAIVQTPHHFYNPDPFQRNLRVENKVAGEGDFFYHVLQVGNDYWNSAFFCGSSGILRRSALESIGGMATETVTEDAHTSMRLHARGYKSVYHPKVLAAGLATERFADHVRQRIRWARGMVQILRIENPLFTRGLTLPQRLNYFNSMTHFLFGGPRLIYILAPICYLLFGLHPIKGLGIEVLLYALPHIVLATMASSMISASFRQSFWAEVFETAVAFFVTPVTLLAMITPSFGSFNVTAKGKNIGRPSYDFAHAFPLIFLFAAGLVALGLGVPYRWTRLPDEHSSIAINTVWTVYNMIILLAAALVANDRLQERSSPRLDRRYRATLLLPNGRSIHSETWSLSETGFGAVLSQNVAIPDLLDVKIEGDDGTSAFAQASPAWRETLASGQTVCGLEFTNITKHELHGIIRLMFSNPVSWTIRHIPTDRPFRSYLYILGSIFRVGESRRITSRVSPRVEMPVTCRVLAGDGVAHTGRVENLSENGASISLDPAAWPLPEFVKVQLRFSDGQATEVGGRISRPNVSGSKLKLGVNFENLTYDQQTVIAANLYGHGRSSQFVPPRVSAQPDFLHAASDFEKAALMEQYFIPTAVATRQGPPAYSQPAAPPITSYSYAQAASAPARPPKDAASMRRPAPRSVVFDEKMTRGANAPGVLAAPPASRYGPVIADVRSGTYFVPGGDYYLQMAASSSRGGRHWLFLESEEEARSNGFRPSRASA